LRYPSPIFIGRFFSILSERSIEKKTAPEVREMDTELEWFGFSGEEEIVDEDVEGLDFVEQQRSLARASRWDLQPEFIGIPERNPQQILRALQRERTYRRSSTDIPL
jgi:hypothetical protein